MAVVTVQEQNRRVITRYWDGFWAKGNTDVIDECCADDYVCHYPLHGEVRGKENVKAMYREFKEAFPDISFSLLSPFPLIAENDFVVARFYGGGVHTGTPIRFPLGSLANHNTGREMRFSGTTIFTLRDGKITHEIGEESALAALAQLGVIQSTTPSSSNSTDSSQ